MMTKTQRQRKRPGGSIAPSMLIVTMRRRIRKKKHAGGRAEPITTGATPARKRLKLKSKSNNKENCENDIGREDQRPKPRVRPQPAPRESPVDKGRSRVTKAKRTRKRQVLKSKGDGDDEDAADSERDAEDAPKGKHILRESKQGIVSVTLRSAYHVPICEHVLTVRLLRVSPRCYSCAIMPTGAEQHVSGRQTGRCRC